MKQKVLTLLVVGFALFFVVESPVEAAELVRGTVKIARHFVMDVAKQLATFIRTL
jgi:hypothetical protein